jgi:hypothetical protein
VARERARAAVVDHAQRADAERAPVLVARNLQRSPFMAARARGRGRGREGRRAGSAVRGPFAAAVARGGRAGGYQRNTRVRLDAERACDEAVVPEARVARRVAHLEEPVGQNRVPAPPSAP